MNFLEAAKRYRKLGWSVFPCEPRGKKPLVEWKEYQKRVATDEEISGWALSYPGANVGVICGRISGVIVLDSDAAEWRNWTTARVRTGRGYHYYFRASEESINNRVRVGGTAWDVRGDGGYVIAPDSEHSTGVFYAWDVPPEDGIAELPKEILKELQKPKSERLWVEGLEGAGEGKRNDTATSLVGRAIASLPPELWEDFGWTGLLAWNRKNTPPLGDDELRTIYESVRDRHMGAHHLVQTSDVSFAQLAEEFSKRFEYYDVGALRCSMAVAIANRLEGPDALWVYIVSPASSGKSETILSLRELPGAQHATQLTSKAFFSGKGESFAWAYQWEDPTLLLFEDMTSIMDTNADERDNIMRILRSMYSQNFDVLVGNVKGGKMEPWNKKVSILAGVTERIDVSDAASMNVIAGSRSLMYRMEVLKPDDPRRRDQGRKAITESVRDKEERDRIRNTVRDCFLGLAKPPLSSPTIRDGSATRLSALANMVALGRHANVRDQRDYNRIEQIPDPEGIARLSKQFAILARGYALLEGRRDVSDEDVNHISRIARDTFPKMAMDVLRSTGTSPRSAEEIKGVLVDLTGRHYSVEVVRRRLEDLAGGGLILQTGGGGSTKWQTSETFQRENALAGLIVVP